ncbi:Rieske (2Fe-2S) protein [Symbioplanes lichenis]|uniref:Rieske (2Fe-2S) protein n=1 Tax=Symbioplanes lichenis TaxID=1629072 RepID=UPI0027394565|nr:Rieske (2Fe-2S) protein [Actinoplanes lichenis]
MSATNKTPVSAMSETRTSAANATGVGAGDVTGVGAVSVAPVSAMSDTRMSAANDSSTSAGDTTGVGAVGMAPVSAMSDTRMSAANATGVGAGDVTGVGAVSVAPVSATDGMRRGGRGEARMRLLPAAGDGVRIGLLDEVPPGEGRAFVVGGEAVAVFRLRDGSLRAVSAVCPHRGGPLADGQIDARVVVCPLHLNAFDLATGCALGDSGLPGLRTYPVGVDEDSYIVLLSEVSA